jgi:hypothetical protein
MLDRLLGRVHDTKHAAPVLRGYLWWGILIRCVLLIALGTLLLVEGNVLAEWLLTTRVPFVEQADVQELTTISYGVIFFLLVSGAGVRWTLLYRLDAIAQSAVSADASPPDDGGVSSPPVGATDSEGNP